MSLVVGERHLNGQGVKVEGISRPRRKANNEEQPIRCRQLTQKRDWVRQWQWFLPLSDGLAELVGNLDPLLPLEEVAEGLFGGSKGAFCHWLCYLSGGLHVDC
jgi:hypothetical protein